MSDLPPFVIEGEWIDPEPMLHRLPREHPYGLGAVAVTLAGQKTRFFPTKGDGDQYLRDNGIRLGAPPSEIDLLKERLAAVETRLAALEALNGLEARPAPTKRLVPERDPQ